MQETHLFIIWSNAIKWRDEIIHDLESKFDILGIHKVEWKKEYFAKNLTRFYGENLPKNSNKEKMCGSDPFTLIIVRDSNPLYRIRMTSKGPKKVNVNIYDSKEMYRNWSGGGHMIHGTNDMKEVKHDIVLLTGMSMVDYVNAYEKAGHVLTDDFYGMPGEEKWENTKQLLYVLNETLDYVILRNFDGVFSENNREAHGDVDILAEKSFLAKLMLNAKTVYKSKYRVQHLVKIGNEDVFFDIRYIGDDYYCKKWEEKILSGRYLHEEGYYRTDDRNYKYSLLYHALVHKKVISDDYLSFFKKSFSETGAETDKLISLLRRFMDVEGYIYVEPRDYSVYFNEKIVEKKMSVKKFCVKAFHKVFR